MRTATRPAAERLLLVSVTRSSSAWARVAAVTGSDVPRSMVSAMAGPASGTSSSPARRTGTRRRVVVSTERSSPRRSRVGMGLVSRCTCRVGTGTEPPCASPDSTASGRPSPDVRRRAVGRWDQPHQTTPDSKEKPDGRHPTSRGHLVRRPDHRFGRSLRHLVRRVLRPAGDAGRPGPRHPMAGQAPRSWSRRPTRSCFAMALSGALARAGTPPERLDVSAEVTFDKLEAGWRVVSSALTVRGASRACPRPISRPPPRRPRTAARSAWPSPATSP